MLEFFAVGIPVLPQYAARGPRAGAGQLPPDENQPRGVGSGFIPTVDGYVSDQCACGRRADEVLVTLTDKREFKARIIGADKRTPDVAVSRSKLSPASAAVTGQDWRHQPLARGRMRWLMVRHIRLKHRDGGIVSAKQRYRRLPAFIHTDVAINRICVR
jgi:serine protease Do